MIVYLYCSYTNSQKGFSLSRLENGHVIPQPFSGLRDSSKEAVEQFLTNDYFRILWQEFSANPGSPLVTAVTGGMFGIRGLHGMIDGRNGIANVVLLAEEDELAHLQSAAKTILKDVSGFASTLFDGLTIGGPCGYQSSGPQLGQWIRSLWSEPDPEWTSKWLRFSNDLLKFAVYMGSWEEASAFLPSGKSRKYCPPQAVSEEKYTADGGYRW